MTLSAKVDPMAAGPGDGRTRLAAISLQPKTVTKKALYALTSKAEHISRPFSHGVLTGCNDEPSCYPTCYLTLFCPCYVVARLTGKEGFEQGSCPGGGYGSSCRFGFVAYSIVQLGILATLLLAVVKWGFGLANPPPPIGPVDKWYYLHYPAYCIPLGHVLAMWMLTRLRQLYRAKHMILALPNGAAESGTDEDDLCQMGCCYCCSGCDNLCCAAWCGCCVLLQMVDDHNLVASEPLFDSDCSCFSGPDKCDFCRNPMREITEV